jgi:N-acetylmuramoyl-L-alanine amidase
MKIVISSGHSTKCQGASDILNEVAEATKVVDRVAELLAIAGVQVEVFHDTVSDDQSENLNRIVDFHNGETRDLDISVHFNCYDGTASGTECLYVSQEDLAAEVAAGIAHAGGFKNRGPKKRTDLFFLNNTEEPAILIEVCFVDSAVDADLYDRNFDEICESIAEVVSGVDIPDTVQPEPEPAPPAGGFSVTGKASTFGGPLDQGMSRTEGLAFITSINQAPHLFLPYQPAGTTGLARRLNPCTHYVACRWDYTKTPKPVLLDKVAVVRALKTGISLKAFPADWGPNESTGRVADLSPTLMDDLGIKTDDDVVVTFPV